MARKIKMSSLVINIRVHPHPEGIYLELIRDIFRLKRPQKLSGDRYGLISSLREIDEEKGTVAGVLTTFLQVEMDGTWFNEINLSDASEDDVAEIKIPPHIHPNRKQYFFFLRGHRLYLQNYYEGRWISAKQAEAFVNASMAEDKITEKYGTVSVTVEQSQEALREIFNLERIDEIKITLMPPNMDVWPDDFEEKVQNHMVATNTKRLEFRYVAETGKSIVIDDDIEKVSKAGMSNGRVDVSGRDETGKVRRSSEDHPKVLQDSYDPDITGEWSAFQHVISGDGN
ncbi:DUF4747 family protein [Rhizobium sp. 10PS4]|uniref:DUF4747 family protein n=1 Tax=Rhizobium sp. 10PS4 TaxID=3075621 RepID=UPI0028FD9205|nr:DUF4747 family protein [Rhizobium sp. 10PS4]MDU0310268.1 DUF4747 family protein [Rhizobium sp. 10PS4]